jgi:pilus assembly protein CpaF
VAGIGDAAALLAPLRSRLARDDARAATGVEPDPAPGVTANLAHRAMSASAGAPGLLVSAGRLTAGVRDLTAAGGHVLGVGDLQTVVDSVRDHAWGLGPLQALVEDPAVTDVLVNGGGRTWVDRGRGLEPHPALLAGEDEVRALAVRLAGVAGRRLDESLPWVDARLPGGIRLHAVVPPVSPEGTHISLRTLQSAPADLDALVAAGSIPTTWRPVLEALVATRAAFLVTGGTGAGKTTLLSALLSLVPVSERLVLVEDVGELRPRHPHVVRLEARHANVEGRGAVTLEELVRQALRMRPDRLVVGECRGAEVRDLLAALNTGHAGGCGTLHANAAGELPARLEALASLAGLRAPAVHAQAAAALDAVVHVRRADPGSTSGPGRRVVEIATVGRDGASGLAVRTALRLVEVEQLPPRPGPPGDAAGSSASHASASPRSVPLTREHTAVGPGWPALAARLGLAPELMSPSTAAAGG